jgi:DNA-binding MarR family transcriptional regulator
MTGMRVADRQEAEVDFPIDEAARLRAAILRLARRLRAIDAGTGFTPAELSCLGAIVHRGPMRSSDLAAAEQLNPTMLSRLLGRLVDAGVVSRQADPEDRRGALVDATARGRRTHERLRTERARALRAQVLLLSDEQRRDLLAALPALEALVELGRQ